MKRFDSRTRAHIDSSGVRVAFAALLLGPTLVYADWPSGGVYIDTMLGNQPRVLTSDGNSGAIVTWLRYNDDYFVTDVFAQRVSATGATMWTTGGVPICTALGEQYYPLITMDNAGGAFIAWNDGRDGPDCCSASHVYVQRVDQFGTPLWSPNGVRLRPTSDSDRLKAIIADESGGAIVIWSERRSGVPYMLAQRIDSFGVPVWDPDGVPVCTGCYPDETTAVSDGDEGIIIAWLDARIYEDEIYAQRLNSFGASLWATNGALLCESETLKFLLSITSDGDGGAFATWTEYRGGDMHGYIQRIDHAGSIAWGNDAMRVSNHDAWQSSSLVLADETGGVIVAWQEQTDNLKLWAQRFDVWGNKQWGADGYSVCESPSHQVLASAHRDEDGGAVIVWVDLGTTPFVATAQRLNSEGQALWDDEGIELGATFTYDQGPTAISNGAGGTIILRPYGLGSTRDLFVHGIDANGDSPTAVARHVTSPTAFVSDAFPNPFSSTTTFDLVFHPNFGASVGVYDVAGRRVRTLATAATTSNTGSIVFDGRDHHGRLLPSGVYFLRVRAAGETITRKMVIAR